MATSTGALVTALLRVYGYGVTCIVGRVTFGASGAVASTLGKGFTVTKTGTGQYQIATTAKFNSCLASILTYSATSGTPSDQVCQEGAFASNQNLTVYTVTAGAATNGASGDGFTFVLLLSTSKLDQ